jgi:hypothetical protein
MERLPDGARLEKGPGGVERLVLEASDGEAFVYLHGAHVAHFAPKGERPVLWMSAEMPTLERSLTLAFLARALAIPPKKGVAAPALTGRWQRVTTGSGEPLWRWPAAEAPPVTVKLAPDASTRSDAARLITFFGMIPNFEPQNILPRLAALVRPADYLLFSANLAPGADYAAGVQSILPLYDNALTRDWLMTFLLDLGVEANDGALRFAIEDDPAGSGLKRVTVCFRFARRREIRVDEQQFQFPAGESIRLFFSWRHTPMLVRKLLGQQGLEVLDQWITKSGEEGVFLVCRA